MLQRLDRKAPVAIMVVIQDKALATGSSMPLSVHSFAIVHSSGMIKEAYLHQFKAISSMIPDSRPCVGSSSPRARGQTVFSP